MKWYSVKTHLPATTDKLLVVDDHGFIHISFYAHASKNWFLPEKTHCPASEHPITHFCVPDPVEIEDEPFVFKGDNPRVKFRKEMLAQNSLSAPITELNLPISVRSRILLSLKHRMAGKIETIGQLVELSEKELSELIHCGKKSLTYIKEALSELGLQLKGD